MTGWKKNTALSLLSVSTISCTFLPITTMYAAVARCYKETLVAINQSVKAALETFKNTNKVRPDEFIFRSRKGENKPIGRTRAYTIFADAAKSLNIEKFSCHSLRKTFGYHAWKKNQNPVLLMEVYNHSSFAITRKYLGILQEDKDSVFLSVLL